MFKKIATLGLLATLSVSALASTQVKPNPYKKPQEAFNYVYKLSVTENDGDEWAEYLLGSYYEKGYGVKADTKKAYVWYKMSSLNKYEPAIDALASLKKQMSAKEVEAADKAFVKTRDASIEKGMADLKASLGR